LCGGCGSRKTRGMGAGRKLKNHRRAQKWADKSYKKSHQGNEWKKPFAGSSHAKGIVLEKIGIEAKQPNSAIRKCARVQLIKNGKKIAAFVPNDGCLNYIEENVSSSVLSLCPGRLNLFHTDRISCCMSTCWIH
jgi:small subunit ribosomal protein S23e